jgi:hypothetical protein
MVAARESQLWPEHAAAAVADNPLGRAVVIEDCGHMVTFDQLDRFNEVLLDFLHARPRLRSSIHRHTWRNPDHDVVPDRLESPAVMMILLTIQAFTYVVDRVLRP